MLGNRFAEGKNSLNAIRLVLAAMVIVSHAWWLGGYGPEPQPGGVKLGTWAVIGFFGISGYLITQSRMQARTAWSYARARFLRIFPGLFVCVAVVALAGIPGTLDGMPDPRLWNGPLWTLFLPSMWAGWPHAVPPLIFAGAALLLVALLAWLSCRYVEGPARRWRRPQTAARRVAELS
ncbi:acyltransferase family protein [Arthrobacter sp. NPDC058097]|uniref:acyltransferase family protein n=1 Tax=Arthrobacter sp. NPDC058097 TaxID=3346340 RepID=UPI0036DF486E